MPILTAWPSAPRQPGVHTSEMTDGAATKTRSRRAAWAVAIIIISATAGMLADWSAPGLERYAQDRLMRARGRLPVPDDIVILAIDDTSISRMGRFPWPRSKMAQVINTVAVARPKVIAIDVLYTDPTTPKEDDELARAVARAGNVVVAAELVESPADGGPATWLLPLPQMQRAAAAVGHVNVLAESEGVGRGVLIRVADDSGLSFRAMGIEAVRIADRTPEQAVTDTPHSVLVGQRIIPVETTQPPVVIAQAKAASLEFMRASRMAIDYIGPAGSFAPSTYSIADLLDGRIPASRFHGKEVLIGATAASIGDRLSSPFVHAADARGDLHGTLMPGVEVLANCVNTILRARFYTQPPAWLAFLVASLTAATTLLLLAATQGRYEFVKQIVVLAGIGVAIVLCGELVFGRFLVYPPLTSALVSFASAGLLGLVRRSIATTVRLDESIANLGRSEGQFTPQFDAAEAAESIAGIGELTAVAIYQEVSGEYGLLAAHGMRAAGRVVSAERLPEAFHFPYSDRARYETCHLPLDGGALVMGHPLGRTPSHQAQRLCAAIATATLAAHPEQPAETRVWLQGAEEKAKTLGRLNQRLIERSRFVDLAMRSVGDGLVIAGADGRIAFANGRAADVLRSTPEKLAGVSFLERLAAVEEETAAATTARASERELLERLVVNRARLEREITVRNSRPRRFVVRMAAVTANPDDTGPVLGIVASFSDVTRQHELQQTKNDVVALVSHEMRTPLTAIQGMSELLASYEMDAGRRKEMSGVINSEAKRLTRMITDYLDIARLESGATVLRSSPFRLETLIERTLLLLDPIASAREIRLNRVYGDVEAVIADPDLIARAVSNLVSNAIHYSSAGSEITVSTRSDPGSAVIDVRDEGYGIAPEYRERIFEKFYRVPRLEDADSPGTGLGLALVREIAELHGGTVRFSSELGAGSTFSLSIPRVRPPL